jgi:outer membrane lipoprotein SlyB
MKKFLFACLLTLTAAAMPMLAMADCFDCGRIKSIEAYTGHRNSTGGAIAGAVVGGLLGNQVGRGDGKTVATVAGAAGGAYAGKKIAENSEKTRYRVVVRMEDGRLERVDQPSIKGLKVGTSVRIKNGKAVRL